MQSSAPIVGRCSLPRTLPSDHALPAGRVFHETDRGSRNPIHRSNAGWNRRTMRAAGDTHTRPIARCWQSRVWTSRRWATSVGALHQGSPRGLIVRCPDITRSRPGALVGCMAHLANRGSIAVGTNLEMAMWLAVKLETRARRYDGTLPTSGQGADIDVRDI